MLPYKAIGQFPEETNTCKVNVTVCHVVFVGHCGCHTLISYLLLAHGGQIQKPKPHPGYSRSLGPDETVHDNSRRGSYLGIPQTQRGSWGRSRRVSQSLAHDNEDDVTALTSDGGLKKGRGGT